MIHLMRRACDLLIITGILLTGGACQSLAQAEAPVQRLLYVASPGIRNYLEYGGHGVLVFDMDHGHHFVKRIPFGGVDEKGKPINIKGICASAETGRLYLTTLRHLICLDLNTGAPIFERTYEGGCDRPSITPDGKKIYLPSLEKDHWKVVDGATGDEIARITPDSRSHNTIVGLDGRFAYLAGLGSPLLTVVDTQTQITRTVGPFAAAIRPFTVNGKQTRGYVCVNDLLGFEIGDLNTGKKRHRVEVAGFSKGPVKRHGCPSHGIGLTPDEKQIWVSDGANSRMHVFDNTVDPPRQIASIPVRDQPGWVTFSIDGAFAYPSSGEVIDVATRKTLALLTDEEGRAVGSEKMIEVHRRNDRAVRVGDQFGLGRVTR